MAVYTIMCTKSADIRGLRSLLKQLLRWYGLRRVSVEEDGARRSAS